MHPTQAHRAPFLPRRVPPAAAMGGSPPHPHLVQQGAGVWVGFLQEPTCNNHCLPAPCLLQRAAAAAPPTWGAPPPVGLRGARIMPPLCQAPRTRPWLLPVPVLPAHTPPPLLAHELACQRRRHGSPARASAPCRRRRRCRRRLKAAPLSCPALPLVSPCLPARLCPLPCPPALAPPAPPCPPTAPLGGLAACLAAAKCSPFAPLCANKPAAAACAGGNFGGNSLSASKLDQVPQPQGRAKEGSNKQARFEAAPGQTVEP
jgi:hypothetical protein